MPRVEPAAAAPDRTMPAAAATARETVIVVEDDPGLARVETTTIEQAGYAAVVAGTADEVFAALRAGPVALLVIDNGLAEGGDGLDLYARVRAAGFDVPAVLITGRYAEETLIRALRAGVRDVLPRSRSFARHLPGVIDRVVAQSRTARRLADSEARLASVISTARDAILVTGPDFRVGHMNPAAEHMFRCQAGDALGRPLSDFVPAELLAPGAGDPGATPLPRALREPVLASRADGDRFPAEVSFSRGEAGGRAYFTAVVRDVTGRERAAATIREQAALLDQANDAIVVRRPDGAVAYWNRGAERLYGWTAGEAAGGGLGGDLAPTAFLALADAHRELAATGRWAGELRHTRADGHEVVVASRWSVLRGPDRRGTGVLVIDSDVTPQKQLEAQYLRAQKMHAVGQLAAGVAHDFNNLLSVVTGAVEFLLARPGTDADARELLAAAHRAAAGGAALVRQLLAFSRGHPVAPQLFLLNDVVAGVRQMLPHLVGPHVTLEARLAPASGLVHADPGQLELAVLNLVLNARDAMPGGGVLTIETGAAEFGAGPRPAGLPPGRYATLAVADTGVGMDEATQLRAFDPFFTTKPVGAGTGLGLATVEGVVGQAGGAVEVRSAAGEGARFTIYLPRADAAEEPAPPRAPPAARPRPGESLLLVDDNDDLRVIAGLILEDLGYRVTTAAGGDAAVALLRDRTDPLDLLVTDVQMPGMTGPELADRVAADRPDLRVLYVSGYTPADALADRLSRPGVGFLAKPFTPDTLAHAVRTVLDAAPTPA